VQSPWVWLVSWLISSLARILTWVALAFSYQTNSYLFGCLCYLSLASAGCIWLSGLLGIESPFLSISKFTSLRILSLALCSHGHHIVVISMKCTNLTSENCMCNAYFRITICQWLENNSPPTLFYKTKFHPQQILPFLSMYLQQHQLPCSINSILQFHLQEEHEQCSCQVPRTQILQPLGQEEHK
jgi:hypothetical protein